MAAVSQLRHMVIIQRGDLPRRIEGCPLHSCLVDEQGYTTCEHLACPNCGIGPPVPIHDEEVLYCNECGLRWLP